ncbi:MAG TPA: alpha/beta hydrolase [Xanthobacteraceae bacterium]|nr:alpha/beta hydrolase [Xanthobacteraceae bacterium]
MPDLADLYPDYASRWIATSAGKIFARVGGSSGPPLLLLHGHPQSNVMWHRVAPLLAPRFTLVIADLPGYGWSDAPAAQDDHAPYTKRAMAAAMVELMEALGFVRFRLAGHDRGGRVGYRLALDHPGRIERLAVLDIVTTYDMWHGMDARLAARAWHWTFLTLPAPFPETLIGHDPKFFFDSRAAAGSGAKTVSIFDPRALAHYHAAYGDPTRIHAMCEDYRAGRTTDLAHDEADRTAGKIGCPLLALWGTTGLIANAGIDALARWRDWAADLRGFAITSGHYLPEENPEATSRALLDFFGGD